MQSSVDGVVLQAIEFWSTVCDEEQDLAIEAMEASSFFIIKNLCFAGIRDWSTT